MSGIQCFILVDDNELDNDFHEIVLRRAGWSGEILRFETGPDLLHFMASATHRARHCVLLDINMPLLDGFETADALAAMEPASDLPQVHMLSSSDAVSDRQRAAARPIVRSYLVKPLTAAAVRALLDQGTA